MTYLNGPSPTGEFKPAPLRELLFRGYLSHCPGDDEEIEWWIGLESSGQHQVLWLKSDRFDDPSLQAVAWIKADTRLSKEWGAALLGELWTAEKDINDCERPAHDEVDEDPRALLSAKEVAALALSVWPK